MWSPGTAAVQSRRPVSDDERDTARLSDATRLSCRPHSQINLGLLLESRSRGDEDERAYFLPSGEEDYTHARSAVLPNSTHRLEGARYPAQPENETGGHTSLDRLTPCWTSVTTWGLK